MINQREMTLVLKEAFIRPTQGRGVVSNIPRATFQQFQEVLGRAARIAFSKHPYNEKLKSTLPRVEAMIVYLDMSEGRRIAGLKADPWVSRYMEKQEEKRKRDEVKKKMDRTLAAVAK